MLPRLYEIEHLHGPAGRLHKTRSGIRPGVTTVISKGGPPQPWLNSWIERVGEEEAARIRDDACDRGTALHARIESRLTGEPVIVPESDYARGVPDEARIDRLFDVIEPALDAIDTVLGCEINVEWQDASGRLGAISNGFAGSVDCIAKVDFEDGRGAVPAILDWKTSAKPKRLDRIENYRIQVIAYRLAALATYPELNEMGGISDCVICIACERGGLQIIHVGSDEFRLLEMEFHGRLQRFYENHWQEPDVMPIAA